MRYDTSEIKRIVTCPDLLARHGIPLNAKGFCCCPIHGEKTASCRIWTNRFHCFGCGAHGDVIDLAAALYDTDFKHAADALCAEYGLRCTDTASYETARQKAAERARERERIELEQNELNERFFSLQSRFDWLQFCIDNFAPESPEEPQNPFFVYALCNIDRVRNDLDCADAACLAFERKKAERRL